MCHFITAFLPGSVNIKAAGAVFERHRLGFKPVHNPFVADQATPGDLYIQTTRAWCDCGTPLGSLPYGGGRDHSATAAQTAKRRKQGWSEAKIRRWQEQKDTSQEKQEREDLARAETAAPHVEQWTAFLTDVLQSGTTDRIGLLLHWYRGGVEDERLQIARKEFVPLASLTADQLLHLSEDVVYSYVL